MDRISLQWRAEEYGTDPFKKVHTPIGRGVDRIARIHSQELRDRQLLSAAGITLNSAGGSPFNSSGQPFHIPVIKGMSGVQGGILGDGHTETELILGHPSHSFPHFRVLKSLRDEFRRKRHHGWR